MSTFYFLMQQMMFFSIPLMVVALGGMFSERSGIVNIALEGIMIMGAFCGIGFISLFQDSLSGQFLLILALIVAAASGALYSLMHAFAAINLKSDQVISGTALNLLAPAFAIFVARMIQNVQQVGFKNQFRIAEVPILSQIPIIGDMFFKNTYITTYIGFAILFLSWFVLFKTKFGLRLRACGEHPQAADSVGINVYKIRYAGVLISGALAGVGGVIFVVPTSTEFNASVAGYGFLALAVLIFGQWNPIRILLTSLLFGFMKTLSAAYVAVPFLMSLGLPSEAYKAFPYVATLIVLAITSKTNAAPKAAGKPYDKGLR